MKKLLLLSMTLLLSVAFVQPASAVLQLGDEAPDFALPGVGGVTYSLSDFEGYVVLINFWQSG